jgi:hypothetical protein
MEETTQLRNDHRGEAADSDKKASRILKIAFKKKCNFLR